MKIIPFKYISSPYLSSVYTFDRELQPNLSYLDKFHQNISFKI